MKTKSLKNYVLIIFTLFFYSCNENQSILESSNLNYDVVINDYGQGVPCGSNIMFYNNMIYRTYDGGIVPLSNNLDLNVDNQIGEYSNYSISHVETINDNIWFAVTDWNDINKIFVVNNEGVEINSYNVGIIPGDFAVHNNWIFIANEGNYGSSNGSITMINNNGMVFETESIGDVVQSIEVYNDKLIAIINNSHKIHIFDIDEEGLAMPGIVISTDFSSPREMVIKNDKLYFSNWSSKDIKVLNLFNYVIESSIPINGLPEDIIVDGDFLWVTVPMKSDWSTSNYINKIDIQENIVIEEIDVGYGPQSIMKNNNNLYIARIFYDEGYNAYLGTSKVNLEF